MRSTLVLLVAALAAAVAAATASAHQMRPVAVSFRSVALHGPIHATVLLPADYATSGKRYPVVYFLHGLPASPTAYESAGWLGRALASQDREAILVHPQGARAGDADPEYLNWGPGRNWETYLTRELPAYVDAHFRTIPTRGGRALIGLSAGGYGAVALGFRHVDRFSVIESWSGYFHPTDPTGTKPLAAPPGSNVHDLVADFRAYQKRHPTFLGFYVGDGDRRFRAENEALNRELDAAHVPHVFQIVSGGHENAVWAGHAAAWLHLAVVRLTPEHV